MRVYLLAIIVLALAWAWGGGGDAAPLERARQPLDPLDLPQSRDAVPLAAVDVAQLAGVRDGTAGERTLLEQEPLRHLLLQAGRLVYGDLQSLGVIEADYAALLADSAAWRGRPLSVIGRLQWFERETLFDYRQLRGEILDAQGRSWSFIALSEPYEMAHGDVVRASGFYFKQHDQVRPDGGQLSAPLLVCDELLRSAFRMAPVTALAPDALEAVRDATLGDASRPLDSPEFWTLLSYVHNTPVDQLFPPGEPLIERQPPELLKRPWAFRGQPMRLTGVAYYLTEAPLGLKGENPLGMPFGWHLWVSDNRAGQAGTVLAILTERPEGVEEGQIVEVDGLFFRRWSFENKRNQPHMASVIVAKRVLPFEPEADTLTPVLVKIVIGVVGALVLAILFGQLREQRAGLAARSRRMTRHKHNVARPGLLGGPAPAPPTAAEHANARDESAPEPPPASGGTAPSSEPDSKRP